MGLVLLSWVWLHHFGRRGKNEYQQLLESQVQPEQSLLQQVRNFFSVPALSLPRAHQSSGLLSTQALTHSAGLTHPELQKKPVQTPD